MCSPVSADYRYWAFISYSNKDKKWALWVHRAIETYGIPAQFVNHPTPVGHLAPKRFHPLFRDRAELPAASSLGPQIAEALRASRYLIVICSPHAARSPWVNKEIITFQQFERHERILALIVDGEPNTGDARECFPEALQREEPLAADARPMADGKSNAKLKLLAGMLGVNFDALRQRDNHRRIRRLQLIVAGMLLMVAGFAFLTLYANQQRQQANLARIAETSAKEDAIKQRKEAEYQAYIANIAAADIALSAGEAKAAEHYLAACPKSLRNWEWRYLSTAGDQSFLVLKGHTGTVFSASYSPNGSRIVTGSEDHTARVWDAITGKTIWILRGHDGPVDSVAYSPDGKRIATASGGRAATVGDQTVRIWDAATGKLLTILQHQAPVNMVAWSPAGERLVTAAGRVNSYTVDPHWRRDGRNSAQIWDAETGRQLMSLVGSNGAPLSVTYSSDGRQIATGEWINTGRIWDATSGKQLTILEEKSVAVFHTIAFSPDGTQIISSGADNCAVVVWDVATGKKLPAFQGQGEVCAIFSHAGSTIVSGGTDGNMRQWDYASRRLLHVYCGHKRLIYSVAFSPDDKSILTGSEDATARLWHTDAGRSFPILRGHQGSVCSGEFSPDDSRIVTACGNWENHTDGTARIWDASTGDTLLILRGHTESVNSASYSPDGTRIVTVSNDSTARIWDATTGKELLVLRGHTKDVGAAAFSPDGTRIITTSGSWYPQGPPWAHGSDHTARVWDVATGKEVFALSNSVDTIHYYRAAFSPDGTRIITAARNFPGQPTGYVSIWDAKTGEQLAVLKGHSQGVRSAAWSSDGTRIVTAADDNTARVWDAVKGEQLLVLSGHWASVHTAAFSPDGSRIVTASNDQTVRIWDAVTGTQLLVLREHSNSAYSARFSHDGTRIVTTSKDGTARVWDSVSRQKRHQELISQTVTAGSH